MALAGVFVAFVLSLFVGMGASACSLAGDERGGPTVTRVVGELDESVSRHHGRCGDGACVGACCPMAAVAVVSGPDSKVRRKAESAGMSVPLDTRVDGVTVAPATGPPKLSV